MKKISNYKIQPYTSMDEAYSYYHEAERNRLNNKCREYKLGVVGKIVYGGRFLFLYKLSSYENDFRKRFNKTPLSNPDRLLNCMNDAIDFDDMQRVSDFK